MTTRRQLFSATLGGALATIVGRQAVDDSAHTETFDLHLWGPETTGEYAYRGFAESRLGGPQIPAYFPMWALKTPEYDSFGSFGSFEDVIRAQFPDLGSITIY